MGVLILADYYEEKGFIGKSKRLRKRNSLIIYGWYMQFNECLGSQFYYGYSQGSGYIFNYGAGKNYGYWRGNGWDYRWQI